MRNRPHVLQNEEHDARSEAELEFYAAEASKHAAQTDAWRAHVTAEATHQHVVHQLGKEEEARSTAA